MMTSPKAIGNAIFSAATMTSFTIPGAGPFIAAGLAGGQALFDIFYSDGSSTNPGDMAATGNELLQAVSDIEKFFTDQHVKDECDDKFQAIYDLYVSDLDPNWQDAAAGKGPAFVGDMSKTQEDDWLYKMNKELRDPLVGSTAISDAMGFVKTHPSIKYDSIALYVYAVTAAILFTKINIMWEYSRIVRANDYAKVMADKANAASVAAHRAWQRGGKKGPPPPIPAKVEALLPKDQIQEQSHYVADLHRLMDGTAIPYLESVIDDLQKEFMDAHNELVDRASSITLEPAGQHPRTIHDGTTKADYPVCYDVNAAIPNADGFTILIDDLKLNQLRREAYLGAIRAEIYERRIHGKKLSEFTVDVRLQHKAVLKHWKECRDNAYKFLQDYPVPANAP